MSHLHTISRTTSVPEDVVGVKYSAHVRRYSRFNLLVRENITSYTKATVIPDEKAVTLRDGSLLVMSRLRSIQGPRTVIRTDPASSLRSLVNAERC